MPPFLTPLGKILPTCIRVQEFLHFVSGRAVESSYRQTDRLKIIETLSKAYEAAVITQPLSGNFWPMTSRVLCAVGGGHRQSGLGEYGRASRSA